LIQKEQVYPPVWALEALAVVNFPEHCNVIGASFAATVRKQCSPSIINAHRSAQPPSKCIERLNLSLFNVTQAGALDGE
jgi:hypothetical protein